MDKITKEELDRWRGDVSSLKERNQRFAQMLVDDFDRLLESAAAEFSFENPAEPNARGSLPLESLAVELARRLPELQIDSVENNAHLIANLLRQHLA